MFNKLLYPKLNTLGGDSGNRNCGQTHTHTDRILLLCFNYMYSSAMFWISFLFSSEYFRMANSEIGFTKWCTIPISNARIPQAVQAFKVAVLLIWELYWHTMRRVVMVITTQKVIGNRLLGRVISNHSLN